VESCREISPATLHLDDRVLYFAEVNIFCIKAGDTAVLADILIGSLNADALGTIVIYNFKHVTSSSS
jgi:hypothetical protein